MRPVPIGPCLALIHEFEGDHGVFETSRVQDPSGNWEIGWSHKLLGPADPLWDAQIGQDEADALALEDLTKAAFGVCAALGPSAFKLKDGQYAALVDFAYNLGCGAFAGSTLCFFVKAGSLSSAAREFPKWVHERINGVEQVSAGLVNRREAELRYWNVA